MIDEHKTGRAQRKRPTTDGNESTANVHGTGKANRRQAAEQDTHGTAKASRKGHEEEQSQILRPYQQGEGDSIRQRIDSKATANKVAGWPEEFTLDGTTYKNEGILSDSSGEAIIFTVSRKGKRYVLKIYYYDPEHRPNHQVLEQIRRMSGSGLLVNIISHGEWSHPARPTETNDYELMDFCEGGSLDGVVLQGNEEALKVVALRMASAIDFLAKHDILHRDIKPANFFYADKEKTQIVLADFGISTMCPQNGTCKVDDMRSPVYAAPEFYSRVPGEPAEIGVKSDYYSLGVSLLCLWLGKAKLTANESQLLKNKLNETLPQPNDMSDHMLSLIKSLTHLKMADRPDFEEIKQWAKGNTIARTSIGVNHGFEVVFNSAKGEVAHSPAELARYLVTDKELGKKYLYSGRITRWLEETGRNEVAVNVEEIAQRVYPSNQSAGLMAVAYMLDPAMEYTTPDGRTFSDPYRISVEALENLNLMASEVIDPESTLMVYLRAVGLGNVADSVRTYVENEEFDAADSALQFIACYYLSVLLNPDVNFPVMTDNGWEFADDVQNLLALYHHNDDLEYVNQMLLKSPALIAWLANSNPALAGKIRLLHDQVSDDPKSLYFQSDSAYRIAYELDPQADLWFNTDTTAPDRCFSPLQVGEYLETILSETVAGERTPDLDYFLSLEETRVGDYLRSKGQEYANYLEWNDYCVNENEENQQKAGPYDFVIGIFKSVAGFLGRAPIYPLNGKILTSPDDLRQLPSKVIAEACSGRERSLRLDNPAPQAWLDAWLTLFFQENPRLDLSKQFTYEKETARYMEFLEEYVPDNYYTQRYAEAISEIDHATRQLDKSGKTIKRKRNFFLLLSGIPTLIMVLGTLLFGLPDGNPVKGHVMATFAICSIGLFCCSTYIMGFWNSIIPGAIAGAVATGVLYLGFSLFPNLMVLVLGIFLIGGYAFIAYYLCKRDKVDTGGKEVRGDEFEYRQLDALYYAFHQANSTLDNVITKYAEMQQSYDKTTKQDIGSLGLTWAFLVYTLFALWYFATPQVSGERSWMVENARLDSKADQWALGRWGAAFGDGTPVVIKIDSVAKHKAFGTITVGKRKPVVMKAEGEVSSRKDTLPKLFRLRTVDSKSKYAGEYTGDYDHHSKKMSGYFTDNAKGTMSQLVYSDSR